MRLLSRTECEQWLRVNLGDGFTKRTAEAAYEYSATYVVPNDAGVRTALARAVRYIVDVRQPALFWITTWGTFPSSENMAIFNGYRRGFGEKRGLSDVPGHVFTESDLEQLECLFGLALYFFWDASLFEGTGDVVIQISHDECVSVLAKNRADLKRYQDHIEPMKFKRI